MYVYKEYIKIERLIKSYIRSIIEEYNTGQTTAMNQIPQ